MPAGEIADRIRTTDWSQTALGPVTAWSPCLRQMLGVIMATHFPMALRWGTDLVLLYNDGYRPILADRHPAALGLPFHEAWPEVQDQLGALHRDLLAGTRDAFFAEDLPLRVHRRGRWEEARFTVCYSPVPDDTAPTGIGGVLATAIETTEQVRTADALRGSEQALRHLNETLESQVAARTRERDRIWRVSEDMFGVADFAGRWVAVNPAATAILGWTEAELLTTPIADLWHPDDIARTNALRAGLVQGGATVRFENRYRHKDGSYRWMSWASTAEEGFIYALGRDVTAEREQTAALAQAEDALRQAQKMEAIGQLTGGIAHDFNNILTGIVGSLDLMQTRISQGRITDIARYAQAATASAQRAAALTHRLLAFARRQPLDPKPTQIAGLVASMEDLLRRTLGETIDLQVLADPAPWSSFCDPNQLENVLLNLAINARDAMPKGGQLTIATTSIDVDPATASQLRDISAGQYVRLTIADTGSGMPPEVASRAFDPFFTTKPLGQGTGLGLSMVYGFAKQSNGHVRLHSEVGVGTSVSLYLPRHRDAPDAETETAASPHRAEPGETVLVIEDEPVVREIVVDVLGELGYRALEAGDGAAGLRILAEEDRIDLLVTDVGLPGMNGRQVADIARERRPRLKVLFITGYAETAALTGGALEPGMAMMTKPFALDALAARIRQMIEA